MPESPQTWHEEGGEGGIEGQSLGELLKVLEGRNHDPRVIIKTHPRRGRRIVLRQAPTQALAPQVVPQGERLQKVLDDAKAAGVNVEERTKGNPTGLQKKIFAETPDGVMYLRVVKDMLGLLKQRRTSPKITEALNQFVVEEHAARAGDFSPLKYVPKGKLAILGVMSTKLRELESVESIRQRIDEASKYLDVDQLGICPQCGFASNFETDRFDMSDVERKLTRLLEASHAIWG